MDLEKIDATIFFLKQKIKKVNSTRTVKYPNVLPPKEKLMQLKEAVEELLDNWLRYEGHERNTMFLYKIGKLEQKYIDEWRHILKDVKQEKSVPKSKSTFKKRSYGSILQECMALDDRRGHI